MGAKKINYIRESEDPSSAADVQVACKVGRCILSTGREWLEEYDSLWVEQYNKNSAKPPCWFFVKTGSGTDGPCLVKEIGRIHIVINWCNHRRQELAFSMYINRDALVRTLKIRFCQETNLKMKWTIFVTKNPNLPNNDRVGPEMLADDRTIASYGFTHTADLFLSYVGEFDEDYMEGKLLKVEC